MHIKKKVVEDSNSAQVMSEISREEDEHGDLRVLKRLDRIYLSEEIMEKQDAYEILSHFSKSDHAPVRMMLAEERETREEKARYKLNISLLNDEEFRKEVMEQWRATESSRSDKGDKPALTLKKCLRRLNKTVKMKGKQVAREKRAKSEEAKGRIRQLTIKLQEDPQNRKNHFQKLLSEDKDDEERLEDTRHIQRKLDKRIDERDKELLERQFEKAELYEAVKAMKSGKSPGPDGTPVEFYVKCWSEVGDTVVRTIQQGADEGWFPRWFNQGGVVLLPKTGDQRMQGNKRPITLLTTVYKIYTKAIQRRVVPVLQKLVSWNQKMLTVAVENAVHAGSWEGIYLQPANMHYCLGFFADDSHMIVRATEEGAHKVQDLLEMFANASGLKIQWRKSAVRWIGPRADDKPDRATELTWSWK
ncbi:hypothetical protein R1sor_019784 [Riccia sorocarpa]|uniref:Reverse transcriptase domain-containing protein n=1 Tax=Riccia sorocarpa TaxID=122646 RepID=A0ABD3IDM3_9MARC